jgi:hypothetical protein
VHGSGGISGQLDGREWRRDDLSGYGGSVENVIAKSAERAVDRCCILASGPSACADDVWKVVRAGWKILAVNNSWQLGPVDALYACDGTWWDAHNGAAEFKGQKWTQDIGAARRWGLNHVPSVAEPGFGLIPPVIHQGNNGGYQAINLALHFGVRRIILLGFDMTVAQGLHWHGDHPRGLTNPDESVAQKWRRNFETTIPSLQKAGVDVINCSRATALTCYPRADLDTVLCAQSA